MGRGVVWGKGQPTLRMSGKAVSKRAIFVSKFKNACCKSLPGSTMYGRIKHF